MLSTEAQTTTTITTTTAFVGTDHLGGLGVLTDEAGNPIAFTDYYPYGKLRTDEKVGSFQSNRKYIGQYYDEATELSYLNARYYDGGVGRFLGRDPAFRDLTKPSFERDYGRNLSQHLMNPQSLNSYSYGQNSPIVHKDPDGKIVPVLVAAYGLFELGMSAYDAYTTVQTLSDSTASFGEKTMTGGLFMVGLALPGGGYAQGAKVVDDVANANKILHSAKNIDNVVDLTRVSNKYNWGNPNSLKDHTRRHATDFGVSKSDYAGYAQKANEFISTKQYTNVFKEGKDTVYWNKSTNHAVYTNQNEQISSAYKVTNQNKINSYKQRANRQN